jgi:ubiquinone/menaquinone biosynthesis C-methylase UbiE
MDYDLFSSFYDASLERLYADARAEAASALDLHPGMRVLDLPCGTGASFPALAPAVGSEGRVIGVDLSAGMAARARTRASAWPQVGVHLGDVHTLSASDLGGPVHRALVFLGMSVFPEPERAFDAIWAVLAPGGVCAVVDVYAERLSLQGRIVNFMANAEVRRRSWEPLERRAASFTRRTLSTRWEHGGTLFLALGSKEIG